MFIALKYKKYPSKRIPSSLSDTLACWSLNAELDIGLLLHAHGFVSLFAEFFVDSSVGTADTVVVGVLLMAGDFDVGFEQLKVEQL